jgi:hypothetical protein
MSGRGRQLTVLLLILAVALLTIGCFGGGGSTSTTRQTTTAVGGAGGGTTGTLKEGAQLSQIEGLPTEFTDALGKSPMVVLFYVSGSADDKAVLDTINQLKPSFGGYTFLLYDYKDPNAYGTLAQLLSVDYPPYLVLITASGVAQKIFKGFVDEGTLNQSLVNLGR